MRWSILLICLTFILTVNGQSRCIPEFGTHIQWKDCIEAFEELFKPATDFMTPAEQARRRRFSLYDRNVQYRIPQGRVVRTCAIGFDIQDGHLSSYITTWTELQRRMLLLLTTCIGHGGGVGGMSIRDGIVYVFTNPQQVSGLGTCLAPPPPVGLQRLNIAQCLNAYGNTRRQALIAASAVGGPPGHHNFDPASRGRSPNQIAQLGTGIPLQPALRPALMSPALNRNQAIDHPVFTRPDEIPPGRILRFAWRGSTMNARDVKWRHYTDGRPHVLRLWRDAGAWCAIRLRGPTVPFPIKQPPTHGRSPYSAPPYFILVARPGQLPKPDLAWVWKSMGNKWIPFRGVVPLVDETTGNLQDQYGQESGWFLIKWVDP